LAGVKIIIGDPTAVGKIDQQCGVFDIITNPTNVYVSVA
jgi:hypothetical protein